MHEGGDNASPTSLASLAYTLALSLRVSTTSGMVVRGRLSYRFAMGTVRCLLPACVRKA